MIFDNIRFYCVNFETGLMEPRYICQTCGKEFAHKPLWQFRTYQHLSKDEKPGFTFWCSKECYKEKNT